MECEPPGRTLFPYTTLFRSWPSRIVMIARLKGRPLRRTEGERAICPNKGSRSLARSEEHTSELQSRPHLVCRLLLEKKKRVTVRLHDQTSDTAVELLRRR